MKDCPHIFFAGCQPKFEKTVIEGPAGQQVVLLAIPRFSTSKTLVLLDMETMEVETVDFSVVQPGGI